MSKVKRSNSLPSQPSTEHVFCSDKIRDCIPPVETHADKTLLETRMIYFME